MTYRIPVKTFRELKARKGQLRSEIFNYLMLGVKVERALNAALKHRDIPLYIKLELRKEFTR